MYLPFLPFLLLSFFAPHAQAQVFTLSPFRAPSPNDEASSTFALNWKQLSKGFNSRSAAYLMGMITCRGHSAGLISLLEGSVFATTIEFGRESFEVVVDTGSSDTWVVGTGFQCLDKQNGTTEPEDYCGFGPTYNTTETFSQVPDENFNITYGDGEFLTGIAGHEKVTLAGITVNQTVAVVNLAAWDGDGTTSGLVGLAYPP